MKIDKIKNPINFYFLFLNRVFDRCSKPIKSSYYLFELIGKDQNDIEIFGANNTNEREVRTIKLSQKLI